MTTEAAVEYKNSGPAEAGPLSEMEVIVNLYFFSFGSNTPPLAALLGY